MDNNKLTTILLKLLKGAQIYTYKNDNINIDGTQIAPTEYGVEISNIFADEEFVKEILDIHEIVNISFSIEDTKKEE